MPAVSVIVSTRNRADALHRMLTRFPFDELEAIDGELILVDNGSTDATPTLLRSAQAAAPLRLHVLCEPHEGKSRALNTGIGKATGGLLVFTDDDCYLAPGYLACALRLFAGSTLDYGGGRVLLYDPTDAPVACNTHSRYVPLPPHSFIPPGLILGANLLVRRDVVGHLGGFDPALGPTLFRCEDIDFCARASLAGFTGARIPELVVYHHHGRKPGRKARRLARANAIAAGVYFAKFISRGARHYLAGWLRLRFGYPQLLRTLVSPHWLLLEIYGAMHFFRMQRYSADCSSSTVEATQQRTEVSQVAADV